MRQRVFLSKIHAGATFIARMWITGLLFFLVLGGYVVYALLWLYRSRFFSKMIIASFIALSIVSGLYLFHLHSPGPRGTIPIELIIIRGQSLRSIADSLRQQGVVSSSLALRLWLKLLGKDQRIQAGKCLFYLNDGIFRAAAQLMRSQPIEMSITIPEGLTIEQTASIIANTMKIDSAEFITVCQDTSLIGRIAPGAVSLEGYLFPDTYRFSPYVNARQIAERMIDRFLKAYATVNIEPDISASFSRHQIVTLASIIEKEATLAVERPRIAGVFHNRLRLGHPLGADPTVRYILRKFSGPLFVSELNINSPYNTRRFPGLPPGPICSPGLASIQAAACPMKTDELYFVALWDGSGAHTFSRSNAEHNRKKLEIRAQNQRRLEQLRGTKQ